MHPFQVYRMKIPNNGTVSYSAIRRDPGSFVITLTIDNNQAGINKCDAYALFNTTNSPSEVPAAFYSNDMDMDKDGNNRTYVVLY